MQAVILDGALRRDAITPTVAAHIHDILTGAAWIVETIALRDKKIAYCLGCFECWIKTPGQCKIDDEGRAVTAAMLTSDLVIYLTPLTFGGYSSELKKALDRSICLVSPFFTRIDGEVHHQPRYLHYPALLGVGIGDAGQAQLFARLIERNAINLHAPMHAAVVVNSDVDAAAIRTALHTTLAQLSMEFSLQKEMAA